jgi:ribonuclease HI
MNNVVIFTDGSSRGNPGPGGYAAVIVYKLKSWEVKELGGKEKHTTNNRMELIAVIRALQQIQDSKFKITVYSDSSYLVNGITRWIYGWQKNGWKTKTKEPVENQGLWKKLLNLVTIYRNIEWKLVGGHIGVVGNERCDEIAAAFADGLKPKLYGGPLEKYSLKNILEIPVPRGQTSFKGRSDLSEQKLRRRAAAYSYVSLVNGAIKTHKTWAECEARVKGKSGAKYKKVFSAAEEKEIMNLWSS